MKLLLLSFFLSSMIIVGCNSTTESAESSPIAGTKKITKLDNKVDETSGLISYENSFWTINDSGDKPNLYRIDQTTGEVSQIITLSNGINVDWEDMTQDDHFIYIGDTGNNHGSRTKFQIYKVAKSKISSLEDLTIEAEVIEFTYENQPSILIAYAHDFDCEALTIINGKLTLFTKNWSSNNTDCYQIDDSGIAKKVASYGSEGLITGAHYNAPKNEVMMIGYQRSSKKEPFIFQIASFSKSSNIFRYNLPDLAGYQTESICIVGEKIYITNEANGSNNQSLFLVSLPATNKTSE
ncbi:MAG: hypothetical protein JEZ14_25645 [Marinilabiliaceae bacterium]|nr:hypothetical protein [Marinilabiliaceae bacterium]